jgi:hypothetical protein
MILHHLDTKWGKAHASPNFSFFCTDSCTDDPFVLLLADYCLHLASARKRSILAGELAAYLSLAANDDEGACAGSRDSPSDNANRHERI